MSGDEPDVEVIGSLGDLVNNLMCDNEELYDSLSEFIDSVFEQFENCGSISKAQRHKVIELLKKYG